jgi:pimeloyl-ACP methyl ester carboxylesterase
MGHGAASSAGLSRSHRDHELESWPDVDCRSIVCRDDHAINPAWVRTAAHERLGVEAIELDGGHSPFMTRPAELAKVLDSLV